MLPSRCSARVADAQQQAVDTGRGMAGSQSTDSVCARPRACGRCFPHASGMASGGMARGWRAFAMVGHAHRHSKSPYDTWTRRTLHPAMRRHLYASTKPTVGQRIDSWENYRELFSGGCREWEVLGRAGRSG